MLKKQICSFILLIGIFLFSFGQVVDAVSYDYDELNRLVEAKYDDGSLVRYTYDAMGNIVKVVPYIARTPQTIDDPKKEWTITFSKTVDLMSITAENIYIVDQNREVVKTELEVTKDNKAVIIKPPNKGYQSKMAYTIFINEKVKGENNETIKNAVVMEFLVK